MNTYKNCKYVYVDKDKCCTCGKEVSEKNKYINALNYLRGFVSDGWYYCFRCQDSRDRDAIFRFKDTA
jgi:hypothetical protein